MIFGEPLGLLALLGLPAILAIHLFRRRFRPRPVSALWLYGPLTDVPAAGRRRSRLVNRQSLWLELLACLALAWWLSDPHLSARAQAEHLVVVLDSRWRMGARDAAGVSSQDHAREALAALLGDLDRDDRVSLLLSGDPPQLLAGPEVSPARAAQALDGWRIESPFHPLDPALRLGAELLRQGEAGAQRRGRLLLASDAEPADLPPGLGLLLRGRSAANDALIEARWLRADPYGPERLLLRLLAVGAEPRSRELQLLGPDGELSRRPIAVQPGDIRLLEWPLGPLAAHGSLTLRLLGEDALALDDTLRLRRPEPRTVGVWLDPTLPGVASWRRALEAQLDVVLVAEAAQAQLLVLGPETGAGAAGTGAWQLRLQPAEGPPILGPYLARSGHPLLRDIDLTGALWAGGAAIEDPAAVLLAAGDRALLSETRRGRARSFTLHLDPERSDLDQHPAWPALVANLIALRRAALPGLEQPNQPLGVALRVMLPPGAQRLVVIDPAGERGELLPDQGGSVLIPPLRRPGTHHLRLDAADEDWQLLEAIPGDARLADTAGLDWLDRPPEAAGEAEVARRRSPLQHLLPLLLAAAAALGAWASFRREEGG